jgi:hypothetical protein
VREETAVADIERLVVDQQTNDLSVGDIDQRLARLWVAVAGLGIRQRPQLVERVEVRPRNRVWLALVEVRA